MTNDPDECFTEVPVGLEQALDPHWLSRALGTEVLAVSCTEVLRTVATKVRFFVTFAGSDERRGFCLKGLLDVDEATARGGPTCVREADFYSFVAPKVTTRVPDMVTSVVDRGNQQAVVIMRDLIVDGATFCTALDPLTRDDAASSLEQIARLHAASSLLDEAPWITRRIADLAQARYVTVEQLQDMLDGPRGEGLPSGTRNAERLVAGMRALASADQKRPEFLVHGDSHAGNLYRTAGGMGLIDWQLLQRGGWALDVAYHIAAVLPVEVAETEERTLLDHYLTVAKTLGCTMPERDEAWRQYRQAVLYGYYLWAITRRVEPPIIERFVQRLGAAVTRHDSHRLLGLPAFG